MIHSRGPRTGPGHRRPISGSAIPIAIIGSISLCARRRHHRQEPVVLEQIARCRTALFDKTGTLTYGEPSLTEQLIAPGFAQRNVLTVLASLERYSKHPLALAILASALEGFSFRKRPKSASSRAKACAARLTVTRCRSPAAMNSSRSRVHAHQPSDASHRPPECSRWHGSEHRRCGLRYSRSLEPRERRGHAGSHRCTGRAERVTGGSASEGDSRSVRVAGTSMAERAGTQATENSSTIHVHEAAGSER